MHLRRHALDQVVQCNIDDRLVQKMEVVQDEDERIGQGPHHLVDEYADDALYREAGAGQVGQERAERCPTVGVELLQGDRQVGEKEGRVVIALVQCEPSHTEFGISCLQRGQQGSLAVACRGGDECESTGEHVPTQALEQALSGDGLLLQGWRPELGCDEPAKGIG